MQMTWNVRNERSHKKHHNVICKFVDHNDIMRQLNSELSIKSAMFIAEQNFYRLSYSECNCLNLILCVVCEDMRVAIYRFQNFNN